MTIVVRNQANTLVAQFFQYAGGPLDDVSGTLEIEITRITDSVTVVGPTSVGIGHPGTGTYTYVWTPVAIDLGDYLVSWAATGGSATEVVTVVEAAAGSGAGPCDVWPVQWVCELQSGAAAVTGTALTAATYVAWALSGRQFGLCTTTLRPCRRECQGMLWPAGSTIWPSTWPGQTYPMPFWWQGEWLNLTCSSCTTECSCGVVEEFVLPAPVYDIVEIKIDGEVLSPSAYRVDDSRIVVRLDGGAWPLCNDLSKEPTEVGTWSVTARYGVPVPEFGSIAVGELACEFVKALLGDDGCALPQPIQSLARQGVNLTFLNSTELFGQGRTGLRFTDLFISTSNPGGLHAASRVYDVDGPRPRRRTS